MFEVKTQPEKNDDQWTFVGLAGDDEVIFLQTEDCIHYGPDLYRHSKEEEDVQGN